MAPKSPLLPVELLSRIFSFVEARGTLANAALCSKDFYDIAIPHLYHNLELLQSGQPYDIHATAPFPHLRSLTDLFLRKPVLAAHVRELSLRGAFSDGPDLQVYETNGREIPRIDLSAEVKAAIRASSRSKEEAEQWLESASYVEGEDAILGVLIPTLTKLQTLDIEIPILPNYFERALLAIAYHQPPYDRKPALTELTSVLVAHDDNKYGGQLTSGLLGLSSIKSICLHRISSREDSELSPGLSLLRAGAANFEYLDLRDCKFCKIDLDAILAAPKALKSFIYEIGWGHLSYTNNNFPALREALTVQASSLESLWLDFPHDGIEWLIGIDITPPMESFRDFKNLKCLRIAGCFIFGYNEEATGDPKRLAQAIPAGLHELQLSHCEYNAPIIFPALEHLISERKSGHLSLQKLRVEMPRMWADARYDEFHDLMEEASAIGMTMILLNNYGDGSEEDVRSEERKWGFHEDVVWKPCSSGCNRRPIYKPFELHHQQNASNEEELES